MPWEKQFDEEEVLSKVMLEFWSRGYEATSMQDLVRITGVNRASLYATFSDKHSLFLAALRYYDDKVRRQMLTSLMAKSEPRNAIRSVFQVFVDEACEAKLNMGCFMNNSALEVAAHDPEAAAIIAQAQTELEAFFRECIEIGQRMGEFPVKLDAEITACGLLASLLGLLVLVRSRPERKLLYTIIDESMRRLE